MTADPTATAFDLACDECDVMLIVDVADPQWRARLSRFADDHEGHRQVAVLPRPRRGT